MTAPDEADSIPKFHKDRSHYAEALRGWFQRHWPRAESVEVKDIEIPVNTGFSNETVFFSVAWREDGRDHDERLVARIEPPDGGIFPTQTPETFISVGLQHRIMSAVAEQGAAPVPPLHSYEPDPSVLGQPFFVMGFVPGVIPADLPRFTQAGFVVDEATPVQRRRMVESGLEAMAGLHRIDWRKSGLDWLDPSGDGNPTVADQIALYRRYAEAELDGREHPVLMAALDWLEENDPRDERVGLSWGDARLGNIIWQDYRAAAVLDWEACALCPTEADVGWWIMYDRMSHEDLGAERLPGFPTRGEMIAHYEKVSGREVREPHYWEVFGAMRFSAIFIRLGDRMVAHAFVPPEGNPAIKNMITEAVAQLLGIENPTPSLF
jgi:aminoglycoside phosphotransferase (APT) family kinase protein